MLEFTRKSNINKSYVEGLDCLRYEARVIKKDEEVIITIGQTEKKGLSVYIDTISSFGKARRCSYLLEDKGKNNLMERLLRLINKETMASYREIVFQ